MIYQCFALPPDFPPADDEHAPHRTPKIRRIASRCKILFWNFQGCITVYLSRYETRQNFHEMMRCKLACVSIYFMEGLSCASMHRTNFVWTMALLFVAALSGNSDIISCLPLYVNNFFKSFLNLFASEKLWFLRRETYTNTGSI